MKQFIKDNSSTLCAIGAGLGVVSTAYLAARAGRHHERKMANAEQYLDRRKALIEEVKLVWKFYVPAASVGAATVVCIAGVKRIDGKKTLAAQAAFAVSQRAYEGYREQVIEQLGSKKDEEFRSAAAEKHVASSSSDAPTVIAGSGDVLCCELFSGRFFVSSMEKLNKAMNDLNAKLLKQDYCTLDDFYYILGLDYTTISGNCGWESNKLMELEFSSIIREGKPCLAFDYNYVKSF